MFSLHHLAELPDAVCILFVLQMYLCPSVCSSVTLWSVSASDSTEKLKCAQVFMTHGLY